MEAAHLALWILLLAASSDKKICSANPSVMKIPQKKALNPNLLKPAEYAHYGTAGYRLSTSDMNNVICRASVIAYVRSATFAGKYIGLYITASHNPIEYNGLKIIDFNGNMLDEGWEQASDELVNSQDKDFHQIINKLFRQNSNCTNMNDSIYGNVIIGRDTRESGVTLTENIKEALAGFRCNVMDYGVVTCPEMHFLVRKSNEKSQMIAKEEYLDHLWTCYSELSSLTSNNIGMGVDTANGVAEHKINELLQKDPSLSIEILNEPGILNRDCGADFVKTKKAKPKISNSQYQLIASFDGDVDRLILFNEELRVFDGDAQCAFLAQYIRSLLEAESIQCNVGVVLSFYSNMGAVEYVQKKFKVVFAQTGIKNFVREAKQYDIGIYFEPNGHGSVTFSKKFLDQLDALPPSRERKILRLLTEMFDPCVGDALANFLVFKALLSSTDDFIQYNENYIRLMTVKIKDKNLIKVDQNNIVLEPAIQKDIDRVVMSFKGRGFVRPSGTEDLVRIFAECSQEAQCDKLALSIAQIVYDNCEGIGPYPEISYTE